jgi:phage terminase large subunit
MASERSLRILCCREIQKSVKYSSRQIIIDKIKSLGLSFFFKITNDSIVGINGSLFVFLGLRSHPEAIASMEGFNYAWVEEANKASKRSIEILTPTMRADDSEIWFSWNPEFCSDFVDNMFRGGEPPPNSIIFHANYTENPFFPNVLMNDLIWDRSRDPDKYSHIWLGEYRKNSEAAVFRNWEIGECDVSGLRPYFGADWGFSVDPTVLVKCFIIDERTLYVDSEAYEIGCEIDKLPDLFDKIEGVRSYPIRADSARPETISYLNNRGFNIIGAIKGAGSVIEGIEFLKNYNIIVNPSCTHCIDEFTLFSWKQDARTQEILPILRDDNNHVIDSLRYAIEDERRTKNNNPTVRRL